MPKVTIWIRESDYATWKAIENKPEWLHTALNALKPKQYTAEDFTTDPHREIKPGSWKAEHYVLNQPTNQGSVK